MSVNGAKRYSTVIMMKMKIIMPTLIMILIPEHVEAATGTVR